MIKNAKSDMMIETTIIEVNIVKAIRIIIKRRKTDIKLKLSRGGSRKRPSTKQREQSGKLNVPASPLNLQFQHLSQVKIL